MGIYERGDVRINYEEAGSGFPLLLIAGGGSNSSIAGITGSYPPFNAMQEFKNEYRCIAFDLRNAPPGQSSGPLEIDRPWDSHTDDQLGLMGTGTSSAYWRCLRGRVPRCAICSTTTT
jgi:pimeloyl-ACP methyl ester carboxylesterase